jgi:NAD(P)-dependent dehydrogenase (short-subunit alcohol dehydrogenase family)
MDRLDLQIPYQNAIQSPPVDFSKPIIFSKLNGKTALITGGASGLGEALAIELAKHGGNVIVADINVSRGTKLVAQLRSSSKNDNHHFVRVDVVNWDSQVACFREAAKLSPHGGLDIVVACAGMNDPSENQAFEMVVPDYTKNSNPPAPTLKTLKVDLDGVLYSSTLALSYLSNNPGSAPCRTNHSDPSQHPRDRHLILVSSVAGIVPLPANAIYLAAKHGVVGLFRSLRLTAPLLHGVRVNMINPYYVDTPILDIRGHIPLLGVAMTKIEHVTEALIRLCADDSIVGRGLLIGPEGSEEQLKQAGLGGLAQGPIVDLYAHDFEQTDLLMRRVMGLMNLLTSARGWAGLFHDLGLRLLKPLRNILHI